MMGTNNVCLLFLVTGSLVTTSVPVMVTFSCILILVSNLCLVMSRRRTEQTEPKASGNVLGTSESPDKSNRMEKMKNKLTPVKKALDKMKHRLTARQRLGRLFSVIFSLLSLAPLIMVSIK